MRNVTTTHTGNVRPLAWLAHSFEATVSLPVVWMRRVRQRRELMGLRPTRPYSQGCRLAET